MKNRFILAAFFVANLSTSLLAQASQAPQENWVLVEHSRAIAIVEAIVTYSSNHRLNCQTEEHQRGIAYPPKGILPEELGKYLNGASEQFNAHMYQNASSSQPILKIVKEPAPEAGYVFSTDIIIKTSSDYRQITSIEGHSTKTYYFYRQDNVGTILEPKIQPVLFKNEPIVQKIYCYYY